MNKGTGIGFDALFSYASMGIIVVDEAGSIVLANPFLLRLFGYREEELMGKPIETLIPGRFHDKHKDHVKHFTQQPKNRAMGSGMDLFAVTKEGDEFPVEVSLGHYESPSGRFVIAFLSDISRRKDAEKALQHLNEVLEQKINERTEDLTNTVNQLARLIEETEAKDKELLRINSFLKNIWDHAEALIFVTDTDGIIKMLNPTAERYLGYRADDMIDRRSALTFLDEEEIMKQQEVLSAQLGRRLDTAFGLLTAKTDAGMPNERELIYVKQDGGRFPVSLTLNAMRSNQGAIEGYLGIAIDISEKKKAEADLMLALEKEKELSELKSRFVSMASHEFRTPLSTVLSSAYLISKYTEKEDHPKREKHVQRIVSSVNMLTDILNDFLSVGRIEEGKIQVRNTIFDFPELVRMTIQEMNGLLKKGQRVGYVHHGDTEVMLDLSLVKHIVMNLLSNAIKFSGEDATIELSSRKDGKRVTLLVRDKGVGISEEDQQHLFERFFRGGNVVNIQGTGLGLHIVSRYAELMNGAVTCSSRLNEGTTFIVTLHSEH